MEYRVEEDLLGTREIPKDKYYGIQTLRAMENFPITGYSLFPEMISSLALVKKCAAEANVSAGILEPRIGKAIAAAADEIVEGHLHDQFVVDVIQGGAGTSFNMNANEVIANRAIELLGGEKGDYSILSPNTHVNMSQSTNDVFPTAVRISSLIMAEKLVKAQEDLIYTFRIKCEEFDDVIKVGRTHLQDAVPIRLSQEFSAYGRVLNRDLDRLRRSIKELRFINMGATAAGTGLNTEQKYTLEVVRKLRDYSALDIIGASDLVDATQNVDALSEVSGALKILALNLSKIANDFRLLSSGPRAGFAEINLPPVQAGSSIMPGKVNPVMAEVVNQVAFQVVGNDTTISLAVEAGQLELNVMEPVLVYNLLQSFRILTNVIDVFEEKCVRGVTANREKCENDVENSIGLITAINPHVGYETASAIAKEALEQNKQVRQLLLEKKIFTEEELCSIFQVKDMTRPGIAGAQFLKRFNK